MDDDPFFRAYALSVGDVLTAQDVADIQKVLADYNELIGTQADLFAEARLATLQEIGGVVLVEAAAAADSAIVKAAVEKALARFYDRLKGSEDEA